MAAPIPGRDRHPAAGRPGQLLRVLERAFPAPGRHQERSVACAWSAPQRRPAAMIATDVRGDLYYRLNGIELRFRRWPAATRHPRSRAISRRKAGSRQAERALLAILAGQRARTAQRGARAALLSGDRSRPRFSLAAPRTPRRPRRGTRPRRSRGAAARRRVPPPAGHVAAALYRRWTATASRAAERPCVPSGMPLAVRMVAWWRPAVGAAAATACSRVDAVCRRPCAGDGPGGAGGPAHVRPLRGLIRVDRHRRQPRTATSASASWDRYGTW